MDKHDLLAGHLPKLYEKGTMSHTKGSSILMTLRSIICCSGETSRMPEGDSLKVKMMEPKQVKTTEHEQPNSIDDEELRAVNEPRVVDKHLIEPEQSSKLRGSTSKARCGDEAARAYGRQEDCKWCEMHAAAREDLKQCKVHAEAKEDLKQHKMCTEAREEDRKWCSMHAATREDQRKHEEHVLARVYKKHEFAKKESGTKGEITTHLQCHFFDLEREGASEEDKYNKATRPIMGSKGEERMVRMHIKSQANSNSITEINEQPRELQEPAEVPLECTQNKSEPREAMIKMIKSEPASTDAPKDTNYLSIRYKRMSQKKGWRNLSKS
eukprot:13604171-Ditylum_brightwellii.AAC.1